MRIAMEHGFVKRCIGAIVGLSATVIAGQGAALAAEPTPKSAPSIKLTWAELAPLPPARSGEVQPGVAGPFVGAFEDIFIVAGGANFPDQPPWEGGAKVWYDNGYVLYGRGKAEPEWLPNAAFKLSRPLAYGVAFSTSKGIVCVGGCDAGQCYADAFLLTWDASKREVRQSPLPPMPKPLAFMGGAAVGDRIFVVGGQETMVEAVATRHFYTLDLSAAENTDKLSWKELEPLVGAPRILPVVAAQENGTGHDCVYVISGRNIAPNRPTEILDDCWRYDVASGKWEACTGPGRSVMAGTAAAVGEHQVLVFGGGDGKLFMELEQLDRRQELLRQKAKDATLLEAQVLQKQAAALKRSQVKLLTGHKGLSQEVLAYDTQRDAWRKLSELPTTSHVTTQAVWWGDNIVIGPGEIRPGVRTPRVWSAKVEIQPAATGHSADGA